MKILAVTTMYPNKSQPVHAVFVKQRLMHIKKKIKVSIICPIPWFPFYWLIDRYKHRRNIPHYESHEGVDVYYPRFFSIPKLFKPLEGISLLMALMVFIKIHKMTFNIIEAHLPFPEGFSAVLLGKLYRKPVSITLRGHDINDLPRYPLRKRMIVYALKNCTTIFSVASALKKGAVDLGISPDKINVIGNGVDPERFPLVDKKTARETLKMPYDKKIILSVGHLVERKGFHIVVNSVSKLIHNYGMELLLVIVGSGGEEGDYSKEIKKCITMNKLENDVLLVGAVENEKLFWWYNAADVFCLASSKEGWANVLLESLSCGTPVVATNVWGTPEVITQPNLGVLVERNENEIADGLREVLQKEWNREYLNEYSLKFTWDSICDGIFKKYSSLVSDL